MCPLHLTAMYISVKKIAIKGNRKMKKNHHQKWWLLLLIFLSASDNFCSFPHWLPYCNLFSVAQQVLEIKKIRFTAISACIKYLPRFLFFLCGGIPYTAYLNVSKNKYLKVTMKRKTLKTEESIHCIITSVRK